MSHKKNLSVIKYRHKIRSKLLTLFENKCVICGYDKSTWALHFHHTSPAEKLFSISGKGIIKSWERVYEEAQKCILICSNCHRKIHINEAHKINTKDKLYKECPTHGLAPFYTYQKRGKSVHYCCFCVLERQKTRRLALKKSLAESLGGKCSDCYETDINVLDFHHNKDKKYRISNIISSPKKSWAEVKKCILLCSNCHHARHQEMYKRKE